MTGLTFNTLAAKSIARYGSARALASANHLHYFRLLYLLERKSWPQHTKLDNTEYGWLLKLARRNPRPLARLIEAEQRA